MEKTSSISSDSLSKVEKMFKEKSAQLNGAIITMTVAEVAEQSGVALATAHKAIKELVRHGIVNIIRPSSRRESVQYIYKGREGKEKTKQELESYIRELENEIAVLKKRLEQYEGEFTTIKTVDIDSDIQVIIKRK